MEDKNQFEKYKAFGMILTMLFLILDIYFFNYKFFFKIGLHHGMLDSMIRVFLKMGFLNSPFYPKIGVIILSIFFIMCDSGKKNVEINKNEAIFFGVISTALFLTSSLLIYIFPNTLLYCIMVFGSYALLVKSFNAIHRLFDNTMIKDRYNKVNKIFPQNTELIENDLSVNIPFKFIKAYDKNMRPIWEDGYINFISPDRAVLILGKPGSGKSFSFNEEFIRQWAMKGFAFINFDFKFPTLTNIGYFYFLKYKQSYSKYKNGGRFACINIADPRYSDRCNPIHRRLLKSKQEAMDAVLTIYFNLDKKSAQKQDFFQMSAMSLTVATLWFLRDYKDGIYCSFPHLIELIQQPDDKLLTILGSFPDLRYWTSAFADALEKESFDQLSGQTASARIPLGKCATDEMFWVMTDPDNTGVNLNVNEPDEVTFLNIASHPSTKDTNAPALGLYLSQSAKLINNQDRVPCAFHIDEFPQIYVHGLNDLIATGRSNKVCTVLAAQDHTQLIKEYGKETADTIYNTIGTIVTGNVAIDTAEKISKSIGKFNYTTQSVSINQDSTSSSFNMQREFIIPPEDINQFSQGEFCGIVSDTFSQKIDLKAFRGNVNPPKDNMQGVKFPMVNPNLTLEMLRENVVLIQTQVKDLVKDELERIQIQKENAIEEEANLTRNSLELDNNLPFQNNDFDEEIVFQGNEENEIIESIGENFEQQIEFEEIPERESNDDEDEDEEDDAQKNQRIKDFLKNIPNLNDL